MGICLGPQHILVATKSKSNVRETGENRASVMRQMLFVFAICFVSFFSFLPKETGVCPSHCILFNPSQFKGKPDPCQTQTQTFTPTLTQTLGNFKAFLNESAHMCRLFGQGCKFPEGFVRIFVFFSVNWSGQPTMVGRPSTIVGLTSGPPNPQFGWPQKSKSHSSPNWGQIFI